MAYKDYLAAEGFTSVSTREARELVDLNREWALFAGSLSSGIIEFEDTDIRDDDDDGLGPELSILPDNPTPFPGAPGRSFDYPETGMESSRHTEDYGRIAVVA